MSRDLQTEIEIECSECDQLPDSYEKGFEAGLQAAYQAFLDAGYALPRVKRTIQGVRDRLKG